MDGINGMNGYGGLNLNISSIPSILQPKMNIPVFGNYQEASSFQIGPDSSVIGLDREKQLVWIIRTDSNGQKIVCEAHHLGGKYEPEPEPDIRDLIKKVDGIEEKTNNFESLFNKLNERFDNLEELIK